jgi:hypothetical protein
MLSLYYPNYHYIATNIVTLLTISETKVELIEGLLGCYLLFQQNLNKQTENLIFSFLPAYKVIKLQILISQLIISNSTKENNNKKNNTNNDTVFFESLIRIGLDRCQIKNRKYCVRNLMLNEELSSLKFINFYLNSSFCELENEEDKKGFILQSNELLKKVELKYEKENEEKNYYNTLSNTIFKLLNDENTTLNSFCISMCQIIENEKEKDELYSTHLKESLLTLYPSNSVIKTLCLKSLTLKCTSPSTMEIILKSSWESSNLGQSLDNTNSSRII